MCDGEMSQKRRQTARIELLLWLCSAEMIDEVLQNDAKLIKLQIDLSNNYFLANSAKTRLTK
jgi:hypothetical protein